MKAQLCIALQLPMKNGEVAQYLLPLHFNRQQESGRDLIKYFQLSDNRRPLKARTIKYRDRIPHLIVRFASMNPCKCLFYILNRL